MISFQVQTVDAEEVEVRFLRKSGSCYVWPDIDDTSVIGHEDVMSVLPVPDIDGRGRHSFPQTWVEIEKELKLSCIVVLCTVIFFFKFSIKNFS